MKQLWVILIVILLASTSIANARRHYYRHYGYRAGNAAALHFQNQFNKSY
jgi:hypothetical protein